jgi:hypothetical protein
VQYMVIWSVESHSSQFSSSLSAMKQLKIFLKKCSTKRLWKTKLDISLRAVRLQ